MRWQYGGVRLMSEVHVDIGNIAAAAVAAVEVRPMVDEVALFASTCR